ncbi:MAG: hybrid sensor histidine kinase/response regulator [bacterium]|nr:hybrid sensor histidine kinase/response regulator [bacterium]
MNEADTTKGLILVVDDVPVNTLILSELLGKAGYEVQTAADGKETFASLQRQLPDLILLDVMLPDSSGFEICKTLKKDEHKQDIPIIFLTALVETKDKLAGFEAGAVDYVTKPFNGVEILARVNTHIQLKKSRDMINAHNQKLEDTLEIRTKKLIKTERQAAFAQMIQGIVHNMRNPITNIIGSVGMIDMSRESMGDISSENARLQPALNSVWKYVDLIHRGVRKLDTMVKNMMIKSRSDISDMISKIDLNQLLEQEIDFYDVDLNIKQKVKKIIHLSEESLPVAVVPSAITQVFGNLFKNAIDAMYVQEDKQLEINSGRTDGFAWFSVKDNGPGIPPDVMHRICDPFFSTKPGEREKNDPGPTGTGLGLHFCKETATAYGGHFLIESQPNEGAKFIVRLPLAV